MKQCPNCRTTYTDDTLQFCLQDGTPLASLTNAEQPTAAWNESETVVRAKQPDWQQSQVTQIHPAPKKSNTAMVVLVTAFVMLLLFGGAIGAWLLIKKRSGETGANLKTNNSISNQTNTTPTASPKNSPSPTPVNSNTGTATPTPNIDAEQIKSEVSDRVYAWKSALESGDINSLMNSYADRLDYYYNSRGVAASTIRGDKQRAFALYDTFNIKITNMKVTPDASGERATAVFDKEWQFEGSDNYSAGKVQSQLQFTKNGNKWYVSGEKDLKVYYKE